MKNLILASLLIIGLTSCSVLKKHAIPTPQKPAIHSLLSQDSLEVLILSDSMKVALSDSATLLLCDLPEGITLGFTQFSETSPHCGYWMLPGDLNQHGILRQFFVRLIHVSEVCDNRFGCVCN